MTEATAPRFPAGFTWGVATSSYQIEGSTGSDGRAPSVWDTFTAQPGRVADGSTGDVACDHYRRYPEDVALMADLGLTGYRFSIAWPRVQPDGTGPVNQAGIGFYDRLVDTLLEAGVSPAATLFHWDLPQALEDRGGWLERDTAHRFAEYAGLAAEVLGDRVKLWITLNEPFVHMTFGYALGTHAPGRALLFDALPVAHHLLLGHGLAVGALRAHTGSPVAITNNYSPARPHGDDDRDRAATLAYDALQNRLFTDPLFGLGYPEGLPGELPVRAGDLDTIAAPLDALGVNYYQPARVRAPDAGDPLPFALMPIDGAPVTAFGWSVVPDGLRELLVLLKQRYGEALPPIHVTENGCAYDDTVDADGRCADPERVAFLDGHVRAVRAALDEGVDVRGYYVWSLMDNFEWAEGFTKRFGLVHVDFDTQVRTPKTSYGWYRDLIAAQRT